MRSEAMKMRGQSLVCVWSALLCTVISATAGVQPEEPGIAPGTSDHKGDPAASADLSLKLSVGDVLRYTWRESTTQRTAPTVNPEAGPVREGTLDLEAAFKVMSHGAEGTTLELRYERIQVSAKAGERNVSYDSANPGPKPEPVDGKEMERPFESSIKPLINVPVTVTLDPQGVVVKVTGAEALLDMMAPTARFGLLVFGMESVASKFGAAFATWKPQEASDSWTSVQSVPYVPGILLEVTYAHRLTVDEHEGLGVIQCTGTPVLKIPNPKLLGTREIKSSKLSFTQRWNLKEHRGDSAEFSQETQVLLTAGGGDPQNSALVTSTLQGKLERSRQRGY
jgi:hypothetical protein